jgi:hypothetical protein
MFLERVTKNPPWEEPMALVHETDRPRDLSLVGLVLVVFGIIAVAVPCLKMAIDQLFSLIW